MPESYSITYTGLFMLAILFLAQALKEMGIPSFGLTHSLLLYAGIKLFSGGISFGIEAIVCVFLGSLCGAGSVFMLTRRSGPRLVSWLEWRGWVKPEMMEKTRRILGTSSFLTVVIGRSIPGLMLPTSLLAGSLELPVSSFLLGVLAPLSLWVAGILLAGGAVHFTLFHYSFSAAHLLSMIWVVLVLMLIATGFTLWRRISFEPRPSIATAEDVTGED